MSQAKAQAPVEQPAVEADLLQPSDLDDLSCRLDEIAALLDVACEDVNAKVRTQGLIAVAERMAREASEAASEFAAKLKREAYEPPAPPTRDEARLVMQRVLAIGKSSAEMLAVLDKRDRRSLVRRLAAELGVKP